MNNKLMKHYKIDYLHECNSKTEINLETELASLKHAIKAAECVIQSNNEVDEVFIYAPVCCVKRQKVLTDIEVFANEDEKKLTAANTEEIHIDNIEESIDSRVDQANVETRTDEFNRVHIVLALLRTMIELVPRGYRLNSILSETIAALDQHGMRCDWNKYERIIERELELFSLRSAKDSSQLEKLWRERAK